MTEPAGPEGLTVTFLGGLGDIGRNCAVLEYGGSAIVVDCGIMFPRSDMPGVDLIIPDLTYLQEMKSDLLGLLVTHGHEDHTGALHFLIGSLNRPVLPIFGSPLSLALASKRLEEAGLMGRVAMQTVADDDELVLGPFTLTFVPVCHSVPEGFATLVRTPTVTLLHSGDWKLDHTPVDGRRTELGRIAAFAERESIDVLLSDATNADEPGWSVTESAVGLALRSCFDRYSGKRLIVTCFASHLHRIQQIADIAIEHGRKIATLGMSIKKNIEIARELRCLDLSVADMIDIADVADYEPHEVCIIATGSQGEELSALSLISRDRSRWLKAGADDAFLFSSSPIPGNEPMVSRVVDGLIRLGAEVVYTGVQDLHTTGHAKAEEIKMLLAMSKANHVVPIHGEYRHLHAHSMIASSVGYDSSRVHICEDGDRMWFGPDGTAKRLEPTSGRYVFVAGVADAVNRRVLRDRMELSASGVVTVSVAIDAAGDLAAAPEVAATGWLSAEFNHRLVECAAAIEKSLRQQLRDAQTPPFERDLKDLIRRVVYGFAAEHIKRRPVVMPMVVFVPDPKLSKRKQPSDV